MTDVTVRRATASDLEALSRLYVQLAGDVVESGPAPPERAAEVFELIEADGRRTLLVAEADGAVVGSVDLLVVANLTHRGRPWAIIENVIVDESARRTGAGRALMTEAHRLAADAGVYELQLMSNLRRAGAHQFYESLGYRPVAKGFRIYFD